MPESTSEDERATRILESAGVRRTRAPWTISPRYPWEPQAFPVIGYGIAIAVVLAIVLIDFFGPTVRDLSPDEICAEELHNGRHLTAEDCMGVWIAHHYSSDSSDD